MWRESTDLYSDAKHECMWIQTLRGYTLFVGEKEFIGGIILRGVLRPDLCVCMSIQFRDKSNSRLVLDQLPVGRREAFWS